MRIRALLLAIVFALISHVSAYFISIDANEEQCFFDRVVANTKMGLMFEVAEGGFLDIDVKVTGPDGHDIYRGERESSGKYTFAAHMDGVYHYCFGNKMSTMTPKVVMFTIEIVPPSEEHKTDGVKPGDASHEADSQRLEEMIKDLSNMLVAVKHEQEYMEVRERVHRSINENTNSRVVIWALFEAFVLIAMTVGQGTRFSVEVDNLVDGKQFILRYQLRFPPTHYTRKTYFFFLGREAFC